ncbi:hypothetical protein ACFL35_03555 [Candidatus Riflebacteria bacterium]
MSLVPRGEAVAEYGFHSIPFLVAYDDSGKEVARGKKEVLSFIKFKK